MWKMKQWPLAALLAPALLTGAAQAATSLKESETQLQRLAERLEQLEKRNAALENQVSVMRAEKNKNLEQRLKAVEEQNENINKGLANDNISEKEPELTSRLKAVEYQSLGMQKQARAIEALDGIAAGVSLTTVAQSPKATPPGSLNDNSQLNYRADVFVALPLGKSGDIENRMFTSFRIGQGNGLNGIASFSKPNAAAFRVLSTKPDDSVAVLGQAWYQASIPLPLGGFKPRSRETLEINFGKMDPFTFFDQNAAANDETRQFLNTIFVHNPLLDAGGDIGVDANGFTPGFRVSYLNERQKPQTWRLSLGIFGAGQGANYTRFFSSPLMIAQAETQLKLFEGLTGNYRMYYWHNGQAQQYSGDSAQHSGWGASIDQRFGDGVTLFGRYGQQIKGSVGFDRAVTLGGEFNGSYWQRGADAFGASFGWLRTSSDFRHGAATVNASNDGAQNPGFTAASAEQVAELYYRYRLNKQFELSPDFQYIAHPGGNANAAPVKLLGLRAQITY